jgi:transketolase
MAKTESTRVAFLQGLIDVMRENPKAVVVFADSVKVFRATEEFTTEFKGRVFDVGIAEQNAVDVAAGMASCGLMPFVATYAGFITMRACEQVRTFVAYPGLNVKFVGANGGIFGGEREGVTHQFFEDLGILRSIPGITIVVPADAQGVRQATRAVARLKGPAYIRVGSGRDPVVFDSEQAFEIGKIRVLRDGGSDVALFANGPLLGRCLEAADLLQKDRIQATVAEVHTLRPLDSAGILKIMKKTRAAVTVEDHNVNGALGSAVAEVIAENGCGRLARIGLQDVFPESGEGFALLDHYKMGVKDIVAAAKQVVATK